LGVYDAGEVERMCVIVQRGMILLGIDASEEEVALQTVSTTNNNT